ncbi:MAG: riboflavin synthase [Phycisphaerae bacterium]
MFTGIIESKGTIVQAKTVAAGRTLGVDVGAWAEDCQLGQSVAVSGVCLTITRIHPPILDFDVVKETVDRTTLGQKKTGDAVNLERSLRAGDRLDGHFVQGHVDGTATVDRIKSLAGQWTVWFHPQADLRPFIIPKGSIAIDGVSLTIASVSGITFSIALIPTTLDVTTLSSLGPGARVNIETDIIARTIVHHAATLQAQPSITWETVKKAGFS